MVVTDLEALENLGPCNSMMAELRYGCCAGYDRYIVDGERYALGLDPIAITVYSLRPNSALLQWGQTVTVAIV